MQVLRQKLKKEMYTEIVRQQTFGMKYQQNNSADELVSSVLKANYMFLMRDEKEERKKQARSNKQTRQSNTAHPRQSLFTKKKNELPRVGLEPTTLHTLDRALYQYV